MKNKLTIALIFFLFSSFAFIGSNQNEKILTIGIEGDVDTVYPWDTTTTITHKILWNVVEPLVTLEERNTKIKPYLATSWKSSNNNRIWIFNLRKGVKFHDGSTLTADDVVASSSVFKFFNAKVEKVDRYTVRFTLPEPNSGFLNKLAHPWYSITPSKTVKQYLTIHKKGRLENYLPVGSGPYKFSRYDKGKQIILESFSDYWNGSPRIKKLNYQIIPDNSVRISALEKGEIDVLDILYPIDLLRVKKNPQLKIISMYGMNLCYLSMNTTRKPFDNKKVRQALNFALDKLRMTRMFYYGGYGVPTNRILSPAFWGFTALTNPGSYEPEKAKKMLIKAGYKSNDPLKMICIPRARPYLPDPKGMAEEIKKELAAVGVIVNIIIPANFSEYDSMLHGGDYHMVLTGWINLTGNPDYTLYSLLSSNEDIYNNSRWHNKAFNAKLQFARELPLDDVNGRIRLYNEAEKIFQDEDPLIPLFHTNILVIHNRKVKGLILYPSTVISYHKARFEN